MLDGANEGVFIMTWGFRMSKPCFFVNAAPFFFLSRTAYLFGHGSDVGRVQGLRQHGLPQEEHVLQHALADREEARRARNPKGGAQGGGLSDSVRRLFSFLSVKSLSVLNKTPGLE